VTVADRISLIAFAVSTRRAPPGRGMTTPLQTRVMPTGEIVVDRVVA
jgi:hypothetical protein